MRLITNLASVIKKNQSSILASTAITGVATTAYLSARAAVSMTHALAEDTPFQSKKEIAQKHWKLYIPAVASGVVTGACIIGVAKVGNRRAMAAQAAFVLTERAYSEYRDKVIEEYGEKKDEKIRASIAEDRVRATPPPSAEVLFTGPGNVLCCELLTGRYFASDMETLRRAVNDLNAMLIRQDNASLDEWYHMIGLQPTSNSSDLGWCSDKMMELQFSTVLTEDGRPCLAFEYNYYRPLYEGLTDALYK